MDIFKKMKSHDNIIEKNLERILDMLKENNKKSLTPKKELLSSLKEIEDYKDGKIELKSYKDVKSMREALIKDK